MLIYWNFLLKGRNRNGNRNKNGKALVGPLLPLDEMGMWEWVGFCGDLRSIISSNPSLHIYIYRYNKMNDIHTDILYVNVLTSISSLLLLLLEFDVGGGEVCQSSKGFDKRNIRKTHSFSTAAAAASFLPSFLFHLPFFHSYFTLFQSLFSTYMIFTHVCLQCVCMCVCVCNCR